MDKAPNLQAAIIISLSFSTVLAMNYIWPYLLPSVSTEGNSAMDKALNNQAAYISALSIAVG